MEWLKDFFEAFIFVFGCTMLLMYALLALLSLRGILHYNRSQSYVDYTQMLDSPLAPGISVIAPAYNEGVTIISNVRSLLTLMYPKPHNFCRPLENIFCHLT